MDLSSFADNATCLWLPGDGRELRIRRWKTTVLRAQLYPFRFSARPFNRQHTSEGREIAMAIDERKLNEEQEDATRIHVREAEKLLEGSTLAAGVAAEEDGCDESCPCHTDVDADAVSVGATAAIGSAGEANSCGDSIASGQASDRTAGVAGHMAELVASAGAGDAAGLFAGMADCRAVFEGACDQLAAAQGDTEASAATLTTAGSTKED